MTILHTDGSHSGAPFDLAISQGVFVNYSTIDKFGRNADVDMAADEDIWDGGATWAAPTQARPHSIFSTATEDDGSPAGVGARTIRIFGLTSWTTTDTTEDITMNGTATVTTANSYVMIHRMIVLTKGATSPNVGTISAVAQTDTTTTAKILAGTGQTQMAIYGVPSVQNAYMTNFFGSVLKRTTASVNLTLLANTSPDVELTNFLFKHTSGMITNGSNHLQHMYMPFKKFAGPVLIKLRVSTSANDTDVSGGFDLVLHKF